MAMYIFVPPFRKAKFCGVPSCVFDKLGCAAGEKTVVEHWSRRHYYPEDQHQHLYRLENFLHNVYHDSVELSLCS
jgi:hypothetical protein